MRKKNRFILLSQTKNYFTDTKLNSSVIINVRLIFHVNYVGLLRSFDKLFNQKTKYNMKLYCNYRYSTRL